MAATARPGRTAPPPFLRLAGHPLRWRLLGELSRSDRRVGELCDLAGAGQSLVSYHLRVLRDGGLVSTRRSAADGRDLYYVLDLARCGDGLAGAGAALHPGLGGPPGPSGPASSGAPVARVLYLCTGNSARSRIAEALTVHRSGGAVGAASAGSRPKPLHPDAVRVLRERGVAVPRRPPTRLDEVAGERFDRVITLCDKVREVCPELPGRPERIHWSIPDPAAADAGDLAAAFDRTAAEIEARVGFLLAEVVAHTTGGTDG